MKKNPLNFIEHLKVDKLHFKCQLLELMLPCNCQDEQYMSKL
jgi:hypothetical protein